MDVNISHNHFSGIGNLTQDPNYKSHPKGGHVCSFGLAINESYKGKGGEVQEKVIYIDIELYGQQAANCRDMIHKGALVFIEGKLEFRQSTTPGVSKHYIRGSRILFLKYQSKLDRFNPSETAVIPGINPLPEVAAVGEEEPSDLPF